MKTLLNSILRKITGYQLAKFDDAGYSFRENLNDFIRENTPTGKTLDIGSAQGSYIKNHYGNKVTTFDVVPPADVIGDVMNLPFSENFFDSVVCTETLEHVPDPFKALSEIRRVLKHGGKFIGSAPFTYELHGEGYGDYWRFTRQGWKNLLKDFIEVSVKPYAGKKLSPGWYFVTAKKP